MGASLGFPEALSVAADSLRGAMILALVMVALAPLLTNTAKSRPRKETTALDSATH
ncbi:hypothetical protein ACX80D_05990 [Arthrobacter sp. Sr24]